MKPLAAFNLLFILLAPCRVFGVDVSKPQTFDSKGVAIQYTIEGKGEPVVLIHGLHSSADMNWRLPGIIKTLAGNHQVVALDVRGHGHSGKPEGEGAYGVEMAEDVLRLLDHLKIEKAHVVGYSMGGMIAMKLATLHPVRVRSMALGGMGWEREDSPLADFWNMLPEREATRTPAACVRSLGALAVKEDEVKAIRIPTIIIVGDRDPVKKLYVVPLEHIRPDWPTKIIDGAGHINCIFKPQFKEELKKWLDMEAGVKD
ncbi:MAG: alpha/beta hydrolase [Thermoguttaceae bacterium]|jgi:pimeloyl-ACP methyl ester carboxylesterase